MIKTKLQSRTMHGNRFFFPELYEEWNLVKSKIWIEGSGKKRRKLIDHPLNVSFSNKFFVVMDDLLKKNKIDRQQVTSKENGK